MSKLSISARQELVNAVRARYQNATMEAKGQILDEFVAVTGYHRKHVLRLLNGSTNVSPSKKRGRLRLYDEAVHQAMIVLWEASDRICGKRLKPLLPILVPALERHGHLKLDIAVRERVFAVSAATIDRILSPVRKSATGRRRRPKTIPAIRRCTRFGIRNKDGRGLLARAASPVAASPIEAHHRRRNHQKCSPNRRYRRPPWR